MCRLLLRASLGWARRPQLGAPSCQDEGRRGCRASGQTMSRETKRRILPRRELDWVRRRRCGCFDQRLSLGSDAASRRAASIERSCSRVPAPPTNRHHHASVPSVQRFPGRSRPSPGCSHQNRSQRPCAQCLWPSASHPGRPTNRAGVPPAQPRVFLPIPLPRGS
jgi:hypothetical protein